MNEQKFSKEFIDTMKFTAKWEGGYVNHPADPGGATNFGVTQRVYDAWRRSKKSPTQDVKHITQEEVYDIYWNNYWLVGGCQKIQMPLAACHFDACVNNGPGNARKFLTASGFPAEDDMVEVVRYNDAREAFFRRIVERRPASKVFLKGWLNRLNDLRRYCSNYIKPTS